MAIGLYHLGLVCFLMGGDKKSLLKKIFRGWNWLIAVVSIVAVGMIFPVILVSWEYMRLESVRLDIILANFGLYGSSWFLFMIYFSTVHPFLEELFWHEYLECSNKYISWTDLAFAGYHILVFGGLFRPVALVLAFVILTVIACSWRNVVYKLDGLAVALLSHIVADISIAAVANVLIQ